MQPTVAYPSGHAARNAFVLERRPSRPVRDPWQHQGVVVEDERSADGRVLRAATVFLTGRECPWRCVMCDLWQYTTETDTPVGAIAAQVRHALRVGAAFDPGRDAAPRRPPHPSRTPPVRDGDRAMFVADRSESGPYLKDPYPDGPWLDGPNVDVLKLYNAGSFFDPRAVPERDYGPIASTLRRAHVGRVVVEAHPSLVGARMLRFRDACARAAVGQAPPALEVAMGLETAHPAALERLHKRITLDDFAAAAARLQREGIDLRVFLLVNVPFVPRAEQLSWLRRSVDAAFDCGASVVSLIPTRPGNGALDALESAGHFEHPTLADLEDAFDTVLPALRGRIFADLWDGDRLAACAACRPARLRRLQAMNLAQGTLPRTGCGSCAGTRGAV